MKNKNSDYFFENNPYKSTVSDCLKKDEEKPIEDLVRDTTQALNSFGRTFVVGTIIMPTVLGISYFSFKLIDHIKRYNKKYQSLKIITPQLHNLEIN